MTILDRNRSAQLCDVGLPGWLAATLVSETTGRIDYVLVNEELLRTDPSHPYQVRPGGLHEQEGPLPRTVAHWVDRSFRADRP